MTEDTDNNNVEGVTAEDRDELDLAGRLTELEHHHNRAVNALGLVIFAVIALGLVLLLQLLKGRTA